MCKYDATITGRDYGCALSPKDFEIDTTYINILNGIRYEHENLATNLRDENDAVRNIKGWQGGNPFEINIDTDTPEAVKCYVLSTQKRVFI